MLHLIKQLFEKPLPPPTNESGLSLYLSQTESSGYSDTVKIDMGKQMSPEEYLAHLIETHPNQREKLMLICCIAWKGKYYPLLDCDGETEESRVRAELTLRKATFIQIQSSFDVNNLKHSWFILDQPCNKAKEAIVISGKYSHDDRYVAMCSEAKALYVRFEYKPHAQDPKEIGSCGNISSDLREFVDIFLAEWKKKADVLSVILGYKWAGKGRMSIQSHSKIASAKESFDLKKVIIGDRVFFEVEEREKRVQRNGLVYKVLALSDNEFVFLVRRNIEKGEEIEKDDEVRYLVWHKHILAVEKTDTIELLTNSDGEARLIGSIRTAS